MKKILVVDDNLSMRELFRVFLEKQGLLVVTANNPEEALALLESEAIPDVIITDYFMPNMTGLQMVRIIREEKGLHCKVILVSGTVAAITETDKKFLQYADEVIEKPFMVKDFYEKFKYLLTE